MDFLYINENNQEIELEYDEDDLIEHAHGIFEAITRADGLEEAVLWLAKSFHKEATENIFSLLWGNDENDYFNALFTLRKNDPMVIETIEQTAIDEFNRNL